MATWKQVILKDPVTGEYLAPMGGNFSGGDADTLQSHPASDFLLKSEYTPVDLSEYLKTATADTKYAAASHTHTTGQISDLSAMLAGYAPASHTHEIGNINGLQNELNSLKSSVSEGKSLVAAAVTDKGVTTAADATFQTIANNIGKIKTGVEMWTAYLELQIFNGRTVYLPGKANYIWTAPGNYEVPAYSIIACSYNNEYRVNVTGGTMLHNNGQSRTDHFAVLLTQNNASIIISRD